MNQAGLAHARLTYDEQISTILTSQHLGHRAHLGVEAYNLFLWQLSQHVDEETAVGSCCGSLRGTTTC